MSTEEIIVKDAQGIATTIECSKEELSFIFSEDTDPNIKQLIVNGILEKSQKQKASSQAEKQPPEAVKSPIEVVQPPPEATKPPPPQAYKNPIHQAEMPSLQDEPLPVNEQPFALQSSCGSHDLPGPSVLDASEKEGSKWNPQNIKLLKKVFHDVDSSKKITKNKWQKIASELNIEGGYNFSAEQCRLKIKGLKSKYERQKKKNNTSGESPATSEDEDDGEIFDKIPDFNPKTVIESGGSNHTASSDEEKPLPVKKKRVHPKRASDAFKEMMKEMMDRKEERAEKRHKEKLESVNSLINVLKDFVKK